MVNYKRVVCEVAVLSALLVLAAAAPAPDCNEKQANDKHYDQRQNGTENYRLNIDGVVIAIAPAESLLAAASDLDISDLLDIEDFNEIHKPQSPLYSPPSPKPDENKPQANKPEESTPESPLSDVSLNSDVKGQKKDASLRKKEKNQRLKYRLANMLLPLLRRNRHH